MFTQMTKDKLSKLEKIETFALRHVPQGVSKFK